MNYSWTTFTHKSQWCETTNYNILIKFYSDFCTCFCRILNCRRWLKRIAYAINLKSLRPRLRHWVIKAPTRTLKITWEDWNLELTRWTWVFYLGARFECESHNCQLINMPRIKRRSDSLPQVLTRLIAQGTIKDLVKPGTHDSASYLNVSVRFSMNFYAIKTNCTPCRVCSALNKFNWSECTSEWPSRSSPYMCELHNFIMSCCYAWLHTLRCSWCCNGWHNVLVNGVMSVWFFRSLTETNWNSMLGSANENSFEMSVLTIIYGL